MHYSLMHDRVFRCGSAFTTRHCSSAVIAGHRAISAIVRLQPMQTSFSFSLQISTHGDGGKADACRIFDGPSTSKCRRNWQEYFYLFFQYNRNNT